MLIRSKRPLLLAAPGWVLRSSGGTAAGIDLDFEHGRLYQKGIGVSHVRRDARFTTTVRASTGYIDNTAGLWTSTAAGVLRASDKGARIEDAHTNLALWCRDLTNAAWAKVTMTTALTATGIDGAANSATTITATGALSTILQTVTQASTADTVSFFVRRRTGSGTVEITGNGGTAWTDITASLSTAAWYRATVSATLVNPVIGLRITTSGDAVDVDFAQLEAGTFATPPILTTTVAVACAADSVTLASVPAFGPSFTSIVSVGPFPYSAVVLTSYFLMLFFDGNNVQRHWVFNGGPTNVLVDCVVGGAIPAQASAAYSLGGNMKSAVVAAPGNYASVVGGGTPVVSTNSSVHPPPVAIYIGKSSTANYANNYIKRVSIWPTTRLSNIDLQRLSAP